LGIYDWKRKAVKLVSGKNIVFTQGALGRGKKSKKKKRSKESMGDDHSGKMNT